MSNPTKPSTPVEDVPDFAVRLSEIVELLDMALAGAARGSFEANARDEIAHSLLVQIPEMLASDRERLLDKLECATHELAAQAREIADYDAALTAAGRNLDELRRVCAEILHEDLEKWPAHGNVSLAIASALQLARLRSIPDSEGGA